MENQVEIIKHKFEKDLYYGREPVIGITINYPCFKSNRFIKFTNYLIEHYFSKFVIQSKHEIYRLYTLAQAEYDYAMANNFPFRKYEYFLDYFVSYNENCTISLYYDIYTYTGGAHGSTTRSSDTWDLQEGKLMTISDYLVEEENYRDLLIDSVINIIEEEKGTDRFAYFENYEELVVNTFKKDSFYLTGDNYGKINHGNNKADRYKVRRDGIILYFQQYDIAPYSSGMPTFFIPFSNKSLIRPYCII